MPPAPSREFRPYRIAMYAVFLAFTVAFIGLVIRSVWIDLYDRGPAAGLLAKKPSAAVCVNELEALFHRLQARLALPLDPRGEDDWTLFSRDLEDRIAALESRCVDGDGVEASPDLRARIAAVSEKLDALRLHLSRCGEKGDELRTGLADALAQLRETARTERR